MEKERGLLKKLVENKEAIKLLEQQVKNIFGIDVDFLEALEDSKRRAEQLDNIAREHCSRLSSFFGSNIDKRFEISPEFYTAALEELKNSFKYGGEGGMLLFFREYNGVFYGDKFYDSQWLESNMYGVSNLLKIGIENFLFTSFGFNYEKVSQLAEENPDGLLVTCHTHPHIAMPSEGDMRIKPYSGIIIGFEKSSDKLIQLLRDTFCQPLTQEDLATKKWYKRVFDVPEEIYEKIVEECNPTVRLFYTNSDEGLLRVPLYLNGVLLPFL